MDAEVHVKYYIIILQVYTVMDAEVHVKCYIIIIANFLGLQQEEMSG